MSAGLCEDVKSELTKLESLADEIDQLASTASECDSAAPLLKKALLVAWYFAEDAIREANAAGEATYGAGSCGHVLRWGQVNTGEPLEMVMTEDRPYPHVCGTCELYVKLHAKAEQVRRLL